MSDRLGQIRGAFATREDPYAGGDITNAQRLGAVLFALMLVLVVALLPISPPDEAIGRSGWALAVALVATTAALVYALWRQLLGSWRALLAISLAAVAGLAVLQWLAGGVGAPYDRLILLPVLFAVALHPARAIGLFMLVVGLALAAPLLYDGWDKQEAGSIGAGFVIWCGIAMIIHLLMSGVRAQRVSSAHDREEAMEEARHDSLTGLGNRRAFDEELEREIVQARRRRQPLCLAMVDIENFKEINDRWSYLEGDRCLRAVGSTLCSSLRDPDACFRWGGDEFAVLLIGTTAADAAPLGERVRNEVGAACRRPDQEPIRVRFAVAELRDGMSNEELVELAGLALTAAKAESGR